MAEGQSRTGLVALPVAVLLLALLTVWVVVLSREDGTEAPVNTADSLVSATSAEPSGSTEELAQVWRAPVVRAATEGAGAHATRLWVHDDTVVLVSSAGVTGYGAADGEPLWQARAPEGAGRPCVAAGAVNSAGVGAVLYATEDGENGCSVLGVHDTTDGTLLWTERFDRVVTPAEARVTVGERTVTVGLDSAGTVDGFHRFEAEDGTALPLPEPPGDAVGECEEGRETESVRHAGSRVVVVTRCDEAPELSVYHADTGLLEWTHPAVDTEFEVTGILAGDPVLLFQGHEVVAYSETGDELWRLPATELNPRASVVADEALVTRYGDASFAGYGLVGGDRLWQADLPEGTDLYGTDVTGRPVLGHATPDGEFLRLLHLEPGNGDVLPAGTVPLDPRRAADSRQVAWDANQVYVLTPVRDDENDGGLRLRAFES
ncbi:outer membrane protein assembly factor BamB family protein [Streptomyces marincola]|uniref:outer membrane protein assembly factor BamB family protein n=1 Tax=Streptomyces marincola TaxID=2878388 RepID=UPI001CF0F689|nr:PQQ-binding-like beta-propeller repeat protein [Streptomyces marincola]UCM88798.1 PQQ-like beta-propeller repeat protein [Streptomyces marincola]